MRNQHKWCPSKYVMDKGRLRASRDPREVGLGSRLSADIIAKAYHEVLPKFASGRLLDLGCGKAPLHLLYREFTTDSTCVDWGNSMHANDFLDKECDLNEPLPFADGSFDTIVLSDVLEHIAQPEQLWLEMARVLSAGGHLIMNTPFYYWLHEEPHDYYRYTRHALQRFAQLAGLQIELLKATGGAPEIIADILAKNLLRAGGIGRALAEVVQRLTGAFVETHLGRRLSNGTRDSFPLGYILVARRVSG